MLAIVLVGVGGFLGSVLRYLVGGWVHQALDNPWFPYGTLFVSGHRFSRRAYGKPTRFQS